MQQENTQLNWNKLNLALSKSTRLHRCEKCGELKYTDLLSSILKGKIICMECGKE